MKISTLIKRGLIILFVLTAYTYLEDYLSTSLDIPSNELEGSEVYDGLLLFSALIWLTYCTIHDQYDTLNKTPILWLTLLLVASSLSSLGTLITFLEYFTFYIPYLIKAKDALSYILFAQVGMLNGLLNAISPFIAFRTIQALKNKSNH